MITWFVMIIIWLLLIVSLASPQLVGKPELKVKTSRNFLILADISFSMANEDWTIDGQRVRRWDAVKRVMNDFIQKREGDRMGLIFFGSAAYIQAPFTPDLNTIGYLLEETDVGMAGQMTNIGKAIAKGIDMFARDSIDTKVMLLLTDGVDAGMDILPLDAAEMAKNDSIIIYTIGIGDPNKPGSDLDETTLEQIADLTDGKYFRAMDSEKLEEIYVELDKLEPIEWEEESYKPVTLLYYYPLGVAIGLVILMILINSMVSLFRNRERRETM
jgi:Ca-activated chloride channel family protein